VTLKHVFGGFGVAFPRVKVTNNPVLILFSLNFATESQSRERNLAEPWQTRHLLQPDRKLNYSSFHLNRILGTYVCGLAPAMSTATPSPNRKALLECWKKFEDAGKEVMKYSQVIAECEGLTNEINRMKHQLTAKDKEIAEHKAANKSLTAQFTEDTAIWKLEKSQLTKELERIKQKQEASWLGEKRKLIEGRDEALKQLESNKAKLADTSSSLRGAKEQLKECQDELGDLKLNIGLEELGDDLLVSIPRGKDGC